MTVWWTVVLSVQTVYLYYLSLAGGLPVCVWDIGVYCVFPDMQIRCRWKEGQTVRSINFNVEIQAQ